MARTKLVNKIRGPKKMVAHMAVVRKAKTEYVNKYIYSLWELNDGRVVKRRRLNPLYSVDRE
jgi:hypothetical protein